MREDGDPVQSESPCSRDGRHPTGTGGDLEDGKGGRSAPGLDDVGRAGEGKDAPRRQEHAERKCAQLVPLEIIENQPDLAADILRALETFESIEPASLPKEPAILGTLGDYTLRRQIGRGGMGVVYEAWQNSMDRRVALKVTPKALQLNPSYLGAIHGEIWALRALGRFNQARTESQNASLLAPKAPSVLIELGESLAWAGDYEEAQKKFEEAVKLAPRYPSAYDYWGKALHSQGKLDEALAAYRKALELRPLPNGINLPRPGGDTRARIAGILEEQGQFEEAFREYCKSICVTPVIARSHERVLDILRRIGAPAGAGRLFDDLAVKLEDFLSQEYSNVLETLALARIHGEKRKDLEKAREYLDRAAAKGERQTPAFASVLADLQFVAGKKREAIATLEEALAWPGAKRYLAEQLNDYRRQLSPDLVSYSSIDADRATRRPARD